MRVIKRVTSYVSNLLVAFKNKLFSIFFGIINILIGIFIIGIGLILLISLGSYNGLDKSLNTISDSPIKNYLGEPGAYICLLYTSPSPRDRTRSRMPSSA